MKIYHKFKPIPMDTPWEVMKIRYKVFSKMSMEQKAKITFGMCDEIREVSKSGIRDRHPEYNEKQVQLALIKLTIGKKLFAKVYTNIEIEV